MRAGPEEGGKRFRLKLQLQGGFRRWKEGKNPQTRYVFKVLEEEEVLPVENTKSAAFSQR